MRYLLMVGVLAALCGCSAFGPPPPTPQQLYLQAQNSCSMYGFKPGTDAFADCMMKIDMFEKQTAINQAQMNQAEFDASMRTLAAQRPVTCNTMANANRFGNTVTGNSSTTCN